MSYRYLAVTPGGKLTILDAEVVAAGEGLGLAAQIAAVLGAPPDLPGLPPSVAQQLIQSPDGNFTLHRLADDVTADAEPNPYADGMVAALSRQSMSIRGTAVFTSTTQDGLTDLERMLLASVYDTVASRL